MNLGMLLATVLAQHYYSDSEAQGIFEEANQAHYQKNYDQAIERYSKLVQHQFDSPTVLYNLGTTYLAKQDLGNATVFLERAKRFDSADDVSANLESAQLQNIDQLVGEMTASEPWPVRLARVTPHAGWDWALLIGAWIFAALLLSKRFWATNLRSLRLGLLSVCALALLSCGSILGARLWTEKNFEEGVVTASSLSVKQGPDDSAPTSFEVHAGLKMRILSQKNDLVHIRLRNGLEGWVASGGVTTL